MELILAFMVGSIATLGGVILGTKINNVKPKPKADDKLKPQINEDMLREWMYGGE